MGSGLVVVFRCGWWEREAGSQVQDLLCSIPILGHAAQALLACFPIALSTLQFATLEFASRDVFRNVLNQPAAPYPSLQPAKIAQPAFLLPNHWLPLGSLAWGCAHGRSEHGEARAAPIT